ncbi:serine/threonine protein phosphatase [Youhaiella tibetensis]|uniref:Serine/threonine protein phosphatase n=1 Tax=Paradevosia tibetensis TaxID=1447062 RepID=A0A5B9DLL2_9HYPH|nr:metallophosphoesterase family protein [Youhaiella tibetensis]AKR54672.1 Serine/threonine protein phosphatase [Devosia sp. H5989]QEE19792.1 serine/threonine protein phosphatase [Youhaiella tibetensis]GGF29952.1 serine/threonine protein phosphatase [Youhaiella tibetensis]
MKQTFVVADLHGRLDVLEAALARIEERSPEGGKVVFTGDYIDRGPQSREVIERLRAGPKPGWRWVILKGNHEDMMVRSRLRPAGDRSVRDDERWLANGGTETLDSYNGDIPHSHLTWARDLPSIHRDKHRIYVHAGVDPQVPLSGHDDSILLWLRYPAGKDVQYPGGLHTVHGHTPNPEGPELYKGRTNLDTLAVRTGRLVVGVFDDDRPGGPVDLLEVKVD